MKIAKYAVFAALIPAVIAGTASADERHFGYSYEAEVLPKDAVEFEQWITHRGGREDGDYGRFDLREEIEYGLTDRLTTALYLNFESEYFHPDDGVDAEEEENFEFGGISSEWKYQLLNPNIDPVGLVIYGEGTYDSDEAELEEKLILSKDLGSSWIAAFNAAIEQEWEFEGSDTEEESALEFSAGLAYRLNERWTLGGEIRNIREYEGLDLGEETEKAWYAGPVLAYGAPTWWATLSVMPQIGLEGGRDLEDQERVHVRLLFGKSFK